MLIKKNRIPVVHLITIGLLPSFLKKIVYRIKGYKIAKGVKLSIGSVLIGKDVEVGINTSIGFFTIIRANTIKIARYVKIGSMSVIDTEYVSIDDDARINEQVYIGGMKTPESALIMGKRTIIMQASYINPTKPITIGDDSGIGGHCLLFTHGSWNSVLEGYPVKFAPITIGKKVWLPWRVFVMPGVKIGDGSVIGADSLITKDIPAHSLAGGTPAKILKDNFPSALTQKEIEKETYTILNDFINYLKHNGCKIDKTETTDGLLLKVIYNKKTSEVLFYNNVPKNQNVGINDSIFVVANGNISHFNKGVTIISLSERQRIGTSNIGEELITFFSRYGVRFDRLD